MPQTTPEVDRLLLGDNPLIGVDHLSQERARERLGRLNTGRIVEVIETAFANGAQGFLFSTHPTIYDALKQMKQCGNDTAFGIYPLLPYAQTYVRIATEKGMLGLAQEILSKLTWKAKAKMITAGLSLATADPSAVLRAYIDAELDILNRNVPAAATLKCVLLHEIITDLATSFRTTELIKNYVWHILDEYHVKPGFATRNLTKFVSYAKEIGLNLDQIVILTPFNKVGFQMNPSREECERSLEGLQGSNVIAMSILASGYLGLEDAVEYIKQQESIRSVVVGVSTKDHASETFSYLSHHLHARI